MLGRITATLGHSDAGSVYDGLWIRNIQKQRRYIFTLYKGDKYEKKYLLSENPLQTTG